jgi:hypothetical protein
MKYDKCRKRNGQARRNERDRSDDVSNTDSPNGHRSSPAHPAPDHVNAQSSNQQVVSELHDDSHFPNYLRATRDRPQPSVHEQYFMLSVLGFSSTGIVGEKSA